VDGRRTGDWPERASLVFPPPTRTVEEVLQEVILLSLGENTVPAGAQATCWEQIGMYLYYHPGAYGWMVFYGKAPDAKHVSHVIMADHQEVVLVDSLRSTFGFPSHNLTRYQSGNHQLHQIARRRL
jgi:hypothetical protein